jgi:hypothetical protein
VARSARLAFAGGQTVRVGLFGGRGFGVEQKVCVRLLKGDHHKTRPREKKISAQGQQLVLFRKQALFFIFFDKKNKCA